MKRNKKIVFFSVFILIIAVILPSCSVGKEPEKPMPAEISLSTNVPISKGKVTVKHGDFKEKKPQKSQIGILVSQTLRIESVGEQNGVLSVVVRNVTDVDLQYGILTCRAGNITASFTFSTVLAGATCLLTEDSGMKYDGEAGYTSWTLKNRVDFAKPISFHQDKIKVITKDGEISVTNITDRDLEGEICVYYKSFDNGVLIGGATYRVRIAGVKANSTVSLSASHFSKENSRVMFLTYVE